MRCTRAVALVVLGMILLVFAATADGPESVTADEQILKSSGLDHDGPALLAYFRQRTLSDADWTKIRGLISHLGDQAFPVRERASRDLANMDLVVLPLLREATRDPDLEIARRAEECLRQLEQKDPGPALSAAAARLIALRKPAGATAALLAYLPGADDDVVAAEVREAIARTHESDAEASDALRAALRDRAPSRRAAAAGVLCRSTQLEQRDPVRQLIRDPDPRIRLEVALALAARQERNAVPVLIDLLAQLSADEALQVEDTLHRLAGAEAPDAGLGGDAASQKRCRDAWAGWWRDHAATANMSALEKQPDQLGYTLLVLLDVGRILELRADRSVRWQFEGLDFPLDAQVLPGDRILCAEHNGNTVTERNRRGEILWRVDVEGPLMAQRLSNGHTFIASQNKIEEVDHHGREVASIIRPGGELIMKAQKLSNGDVACITTQGLGQRYARLNAAGKELLSFPVNVRTSGGRVDVLPNGNVLIPENLQNRIVEYEPNGRIIWQAAVEEPIAAIRLSSGNTLVTSMRQLRALELDRSGRKELWEYRDTTRVTRAFRR